MTSHGMLKDAIPCILAIPLMLMIELLEVD